MTECEQKTDSFLNSYYAREKDTHAVMTTSTSLPATSATTTVSPTFLQPSYTQDLTITPSCTQSVVCQPVYTSAMPGIPTERSSSHSLKSCEKNAQTMCTNSIMALGILLALAVVLLAVVTIGWVYTCLIMKKRQDPAQNRYM